MSLGEVAYEAWRARIPKPHGLPPWKGLPASVRTAWHEIADATVKAAVAGTPGQQAQE